MSSTSIQSTDNQSFRATKSLGNRLWISHWFAKLHAQETGCQKCDFYQSGLSPAEKWGRLTSRPLIKCLRPPRIDLRVWLDSSCQFGQVSISQLSSDGQTGSDQLLEVKFFFLLLEGWRTTALIHLAVHVLYRDDGQRLAIYMQIMFFLHTAKFEF